MPADTVAPHEDISPGSLRAWAVAIRPRTLWIAAIPVVVATCLAWMHGATILAWVAALAFVASILMQVITNLQNDVGYTARGLETGRRVGLPRATARGWLTPGRSRRNTAPDAQESVCQGEGREAMGPMRAQRDAGSGKPPPNRGCDRIGSLNSLQHGTRIGLRLQRIGIFLQQETACHRIGCRALHRRDVASVGPIALFQ